MSRACLVVRNIPYTPWETATRLAQDAEDICAKVYATTDVRPVRCTLPYVMSDLGVIYTIHLPHAFADRLQMPSIQIMFLLQRILNDRSAIVLVATDEPVSMIEGFVTSPILVNDRDDSSSKYGYLRTTAQWWEGSLRGALS